ncbi:MAG: DUF3995 domain-containing protein [Aurantibacter sp.]
MFVIIGVTMFLIILALSILHFYWLLGGKWGFDNALPKSLNGERLLNPKKGSTALVGLILLSFALYFLNRVLNYGQLPAWIDQVAGWGIPIVFLLRAVGDFNYIGFFKKVKKTAFGRLDSRYYSPLCLLLALIGFFLQFIH